MAEFSEGRSHHVDEFAALSPFAKRSVNGREYCPPDSSPKQLKTDGVIENDMKILLDYRSRPEALKWPFQGSTRVVVPFILSETVKNSKKGEVPGRLTDGAGELSASRFVTAQITGG
jgi:hypothetical protein